MKFINTSFLCAADGVFFSSRDAFRALSENGIKARRSFAVSVATVFFFFSFSAHRELGLVGVTCKCDVNAPRSFTDHLQRLSLESETFVHLVNHLRL